MIDLWIINQYAIPPDLPGGTRHFDLATELAQRDIRVKIFAADVNLALRQHTRLHDGELYKRERVGDVEFVWIDTALYQKNNWRRALNMFSFYRNTIRVCREVARDGKPSVIIGSSPHPLAALAAQRVARKLGAVFVLEVRDLWPQSLVDLKGISPIHPLIVAMSQLERFLYRSAARIIVLARGSIDYIARLGIPIERISFIPNGVHFGHFQATQDRETARKRFGFDDFTIVYAGAHGLANGLESILDAATHLASESLTFALVGSGPAKDSLVARASAMKLTNVRFLDPVPKNEIPNLLSAADAGIITLRDASAFTYGVSPNKLFDYMGAALPVLCSVRGDMAAMVNESHCGVTVPPEDPKAIANAARRLFAMTQAERLALGNAGRAWVEEHFRREVLAGRFAQVVEDAAAVRR